MFIFKNILVFRFHQSKRWKLLDLEKMVSNAKIMKYYLILMLKKTNFNAITMTNIYQQLKHELHVNMSYKKAFIY